MRDLLLSAPIDDLGKILRLRGEVPENVVCTLTGCYRDCRTVKVCPAIAIVPERLRRRSLYVATE